ncbi:MAG TPA: gingipain R, partial [Candidatus Syntrophosphaera thermopropionivorans]|nr:gingipain R [Candidatus Syntrophosphaera thermopropionivorans]
MKHYLWIAIMLAVCCLAAAMNENYITTTTGLLAHLENVRVAPVLQQPEETEEFPETTLISKTFALPYNSIDLQVQNLQWNVFDNSGNFLYQEQAIEPGILRIGNSFTFREMRGYTILIETQINEGETIRTLASADFSLTGSEPIEIPENISPAFIDAYKALADNFQTSYLRNL